MLRSWLVLCTLFLPAAVLSGQEDAVKKERVRLAGVWIVESVEFVGKKGESSKGDRFFFTAEKLTIKSEAKEDVQTYKIDPSKKPKEIEFKCENMIFLGIYEMDGDTLRLCISTSGKRPSAFDSKQGLLSVLKRGKK